MDKIIFKKLSENATIPSFAHKGDAGLDLCASERCEIAPKSWGLVKTGLAVKLPNGTEAQIRSRSGLALKRGVFVLNSPGTIDEGYRGEVGIILCNLSDENFVVNVGDRIAQMVVSRLYQFDITVGEVDQNTQRGEGGFGSSGVWNL